MGFLDRLRRRDSVEHEYARPAATTATIKVATVLPAFRRLPEVPYKAALEALLTKRPAWLEEPRHEPAAQAVHPVESCSHYHGRLVGGIAFHPFVAAVHRAFCDHRPLVLSPDMIWLLIAQGLANHVNAHAEELRPRLVCHQGKMWLAVRRDDFVKGSPENPWPEVFGEFTAAIRRHIGEQTHDLLVPDFTTTGPVEKAAAQIVVLDAMQHYFSYEFITLCGIPQVTLEGTAADWESLEARTRRLDRFGMAWWTETLLPILEEFIQTVRGKGNRQFWQSIYKLDGGSGGPYTTGWITAFFPYFQDHRSGLATRKNRWLDQGGQALRELLYPPARREPHRFNHGPTTEAFPSGLAKAPFVWTYLDRSFPMEFLGGFVGVRQDAGTLELRPEIGWAVREAGT
jgi:hypothetical protein